MDVRKYRNYRTIWGVVFLFVALWGVIIHGQEGDRVAERFLNNVVQLTATFSDCSMDHGFGFVVGERGKTLFVVTANHVVRKNSPGMDTEYIQARFYEDRGKAHEAILLDLAFGNLDLALLEISKPFEAYSWEPQFTYSTPKRGDKVWFIGLNQDWRWPTDNKAGDIEEAPLLGNLPVSIDSVQPGTSGAPMFTQEGIVGMIIKDSHERVTVLEIATIRQVVQERWGYPWNLKEFEEGLAPEPEPIPTNEPSTQPTLSPKETTASIPQITLRSEPLTTSSTEEAKKVFDIYQTGLPRQYIENDYEDKGEVVIDHTTGLMWQKSRSEENILSQDARVYIEKLNQDMFAGYNDWRFPTVNELLSLKEPRKQSNGMYIHFFFVTTPGKVEAYWSADYHTTPELLMIWIVGYNDIDERYIINTNAGGYFRTRAVRSITPSQEPVPSPTAELSATPQAGDEWTDPITGMEFVWIPEGCFQMGQTQQETEELLPIVQEVGEEGKEVLNSDLPRHRVCLDGFWMGKYEVTNAQYRRWKATHDSTDYEGYPLNGDNQPVVYVSWEEANAFTDWLTQQNGGKYMFRLPTEAEWEYAARAGTTTSRFWGNKVNEACQYANIHDQASIQILNRSPYEYECNDGYAVTAPVGSFRPNMFGLYNIFGNVSEWCQDWYDSEYYSNSPSKNPSGPSSGTQKIRRGGNWRNNSLADRFAYRNPESLDFPRDHIGLRLVRVP